MEVSGYYGKKMLWEMVYYHVVEEPKDNDKIGPRGFNFNVLMWKRGGREDKD